MAFLLSDMEENESHDNSPRRRGVQRLAVALVACALACAFGYGDRRSRIERMVCTSEAPLTVVKTAEGCFMCPTTVGYVSEVVTYNYVVGGRVYVVHDERENSRRLDDRHYFDKVCFEPANPRNAYFADAPAKCGAE